MNAITRRAMAELVAPMSPAPSDPVEAAARDRLIAAGVVTGREPSKLDVVARYRGKRALLGYLLGGKGEG